MLGKSITEERIDDDGRWLAIWTRPGRPAGQYLPEGLTVPISKQELIVAALDLARENRIHVFEFHLDSGDFDDIAFLKDQFVLVDKLRGSQMDFDRVSVAKLKHDVGTHAAADGAHMILDLFDRAFE